MSAKFNKINKYIKCPESNFYPLFHFTIYFRINLISVQVNYFFVFTNENTANQVQTQYVHLTEISWKVAGHVVGCAEVAGRCSCVFTQSGRNDV